MLGSGVYFGKGHLNTAAKIPGPSQTNQTVEIPVILLALQRTDLAVPLAIVTGSRYAMDGLTKHLQS